MEKYFAKSEEYAQAIDATVNDIKPEYVHVDGWSIDEKILNVLLNDEICDVTASEWDKHFRKEFGLKALFCGGEINKLPPTVRDAFELAEEIYYKLQTAAFDEKVTDTSIDKKKYNFAKRGEEAHFDNAGSELGSVIRVDVRTQAEKGTLIYWNQGYSKGKVSNRCTHLAKVYVLNFIEEFDEEQAITKAQLLKAKGIKAVDLL